MADTPGDGCRYCSSDVSHLAVVQDIANSRVPHSCQTPHHVTVYCGVMRRCRRSRKTGFQHVLESGSSTAGTDAMASRQTTYHPTLGTTLF